MATLRDIKRRIKSVQSTQQITKAMKMVAAAKLAKAQQKMLRMRPYANDLEALVGGLIAGTTGDEHPLLLPRPVRNVCVVVIAGDKGLCGAFNTSILRHASEFIERECGAASGVQVIPVGRKGLVHFRKEGRPILAHYVDIFETASYSTAFDVARLFVAGYQEEKFDEVCFVYNEFISVVKQRRVVKRVLPLDKERFTAPERDAADDKAKPFAADLITAEPGIEDVCGAAITRYLATETLRAMFESHVSELGARMVAMDNATENAEEMIRVLTLEYNRARQAAITKEILDIVGGAEALK